MTQVLIIDDDRAMCEMLAGLVNQMGYKAVCEYTLDTGLKEVQSRPYDVVLLDVQLPDGSGLDILPKIRETDSSPEVIIMTGFSDEDGAEIAIKSGAWDYIQKTDSPQKITLPLKRVIQYRDGLIRKQKSPVALNLDGIIGTSTQMKACFDLLAQAAGSDVNVLLAGETGTGKELFARAIHKNSRRLEQNFVVVDCTALPETLVESLLFGHQKGAFTGADKNREGLVLQAHGGTLFLDEVGELPFTVQKVFLRVLQELRFRPVGSEQEVRSDFRLVAATNRNIDQWVQAGRFRSDLLYRLRALTISLPALREHPDDIGQMAIYHVAKLCERHQLKHKGFSPEFIEALTIYPWPGNVRELIKTLEVAVTAAGPGQILFPKHLPEYVRIFTTQSVIKIDRPPKDRAEKINAASMPLKSLKEFRKNATALAEREYLQELVSLTRGDTKAACQISELSRSRFYELIKKHSISIPG
ncbi:MAG: sigma-54 dependent transcriptional regulator [Candidatus Desulfatibia sp.]|uniref:sigma-54-dependent transcriptional regulator n=1 Tax=Candidatus Desulfatibia sp. TaxID=3101189 RepID=UPI002F2D33D0